MPLGDVVIVLSVILLSVAVQAYALYHLFNRNRFITDDSRRIWAIIIILGSFVGALTYFLVVKSNQ